MNNPTAANERRDRNYELAWGVRIRKAPEEMTREELIDALDQVGDFASRKLNDAILMERLLNQAFADKDTP